MASNTKQTRKIRAKKAKKMGKQRKTQNANKGTTLTREELFKIEE